MSGRILYIQKDNKTEKFTIDQDRLILGRDKKCDVFLDDTEISRKHAAILNKFGVIYVENISSTGQILLDEKPVEFAELSAKKKINIGPYVIFWDDENAPMEALTEQPLDTAAPNEEASVENRDNNPETIEPLENAQLPDLDSPQQEMEIPQLAGENEVADLGEVEKGDQGTAAILGELQGSEDPPADGPSLSIDEEHSNESNIGMSASGATQILDSTLPATLKVTKGETIGREYKLEKFVEWSVGRGSKNEIQIESQKISRQHFKIIRVGPGFRIQDLGSSNGTKVNGVAITESPLNSFDTIQAGQVEFQFLIGTPETRSASGINTGLGLIEKTSLASGVALVSATQQGASPQFASTNGQGASTVPGFSPASQNPFALANANPNSTIPNTRLTRLGLTGAAKDMMQNQKGFVSSSKNASRSESLFVKFSNQPPARKVLIVLILLIFTGFLLQSNSPDSNFGMDLMSYLNGENSQFQVAEAPPTPTSADIAPNREATSEARNLASTSGPSNSGISVSTATPSTAPNVSPTEASQDFFALSDSEKAKIEELYQKALMAQNQDKWNEAYDLANQVRSKVKKYKNTTDIIFNAQNQLNEDSLGSISQAAGSAEEAQANNAEILSVSLGEGEKALREQRWADAKENFNRALILDPSNTAAKMGLEKAFAEDLGAEVNTPDAVTREVAELNEDPNTERKEAEKDYLQSLKTKYQDARNKINASAFGRALHLLKELDGELKSKVEELNDAIRTPASVRTESIEETRLLLTKVKEASDLARTQLMTEYQTQMADAEEMTTNKQYIQAREIYDRILKVEPDFDDIREARSRLYSKIIVEAKNSYQEALIYESVGDLEEAKSGYLKSTELLTNVKDAVAQEYLRKADERYNRIKR